MSRSSAKERSRVQDSGRHISTFRVMENFGSWKHNFYLPYDSPAIKPLNRRFIGGKNSGRKLAISAITVEIRKPTKRMVKKFWDGCFGSAPEFKLATMKIGSNYPNPKRHRRMAKEMLTAEMTTLLEDQREALELERFEEAERDEAEAEETDWRLGQKQRSEELGQLARIFSRASGTKSGEWGYHHFF